MAPVKRKGDTITSHFKTKKAMTSRNDPAGRVFNRPRGNGRSKLMQRQSRKYNTAANYKSFVRKNRKRGGKTRVGARRAHVNPGFKKKVLKALEETEKSGQFHFLKGHAISTPDISNRVFYWAGVGNIQNLPVLGTPLQVINIASYLWNNKDFNEDWTDVTNNFPEDDLHIHVTSQTSYLGLTNFTQRNWKVTFYECVPRNDQSNSPLNDVDAELNADVWTAAVPKPNRAGVTFTNTGEGWNAGVGGHVTTTNHGQTMRPEYLPGFRNSWRITQKTVTLAPGRTKHFTVRIGEMTYKAETFTETDGTVFRYHRNLTKTWFFRMEPEITLANDDTVGFKPAPSTSPHFLYTRRDKIYMKQPSYTSNIDPSAAGGRVVASNKQDVYAFVNYLDLTTAASATSRLDPKIPTLYEGTVVAATMPT